MKKTALVIMAAGIGSRFGKGIKQLAPVGPNGEIIMEYSIYDALEAGFNKVVFIIRKDLEEEFRAVIGNKIEQITEVEYAFQSLEDLPDGFEKPADRTKPWGTGQAVLAAKNVLSEPFMVINADDYYGKEAYVKVHDYLVQEQPEDGLLHICMAGFRLGNTLSDNGSVTRGVCHIENGALTGVTETHDIYKTENGAESRNADGTAEELDVNSLVSMNMWGLTPAFMDVLEKGFVEFLQNLDAADIRKEYLLPEMIDRLIDEEAVRTSPIHFGLVMTELGSLRSVQCPIEDIPEGQLKDYMLASSACFPALRPREIDGVKYIDGGWRDNMPLDLAAKMGAAELLGVDVDGIGIVRPNTTGLPTRIVRSHWDLGPTLDFDPARAGRNIALGYFDTLRLFGRCGGTAYAMLPDNEEFLARFAEQYQKLLAEVCARAPEIDLVEKNARQRANYPAPYAPNPSAPTRGALAPLELAAERVGVPEDMPYTPKLLAATFMGSFDKDPADRFPALLDGRDNTLVTERAIAAAVPEEFVTALVSKTLGELPIL